MSVWRDLPLPDGSYSDDTRPWTQQDVINYLPTFAEQSGTRSRINHKTAPGLALFSAVGSGPHRGGRDVEGRCFVVSGNKLYLVSTTGDPVSLGTIPGTGLVTMTHNQVAGGNQLVIGTGDNSYVYDTSDSTFTANGIPLLSVDFLDQVILGVDSQRRFWRYSDLANAKSYPTTQNESAESSPDRIVGGCVSQGEWLVFGERTIEPWTFAPTATTAFQRNTGAIAERGCANANTIKRLDNSVFFVDNNNIPCRLQGYTPVPIAPKAIIQALAGCDPAKMLAYTWEDKGYVVYYVTCQDGHTFGYDVTSQKWHRRESFGLDRWRLNTLFKWNGDWYGGDYSNGNLYKLTWGYVFEGCEIMPRRLRTGVLHNNGNRVFVHGLRLNVASGASESISECKPCGDTIQYQGGQAVPSVTQVNVGSEPGYLIFKFATGGVPDRAQVYVAGELKLDTGWRGDASYQATLDAACVIYGLTTGTITPQPVPGESAYTQWNNGNAVSETVGKPGNETLVTVKIYAPLSNTAWKFQLGCPGAVPALSLAITGHLPGGSIGATGTFQYVVIGGAPPYVVTQPTGAFPGGATMDANGLVTYTYTTDGTFTWGLHAVDSLGTTADHPDTTIISAVSLWNPAETGADAVLINSGRTLNSHNVGVGVSGLRVTRSIVGYSTGKRYFEVEVTANGAPTNQMDIGVANTSTAAISGVLGGDNAGWSLDSKTGYSFHAGNIGSLYPTPFGSVGDVIGVAVDIDNHLICFRVNGVWGANPALSESAILPALLPWSGLVYAAADVGVNTDNTQQLTLNTGYAAFANTIPAGYTAWSAP